MATRRRGHRIAFTASRGEVENVLQWNRRLVVVLIVVAAVVAIALVAGYDLSADNLEW